MTKQGKALWCRAARWARLEAIAESGYAASAEGIRPLIKPWHALSYALNETLRLKIALAYGRCGGAQCQAAAAVIAQRLLGHPTSVLATLRMQRPARRMQQTTRDGQHPTRSGAIAQSAPLRPFRSCTTTTAYSPRTSRVLSAYSLHAQVHDRHSARIARRSHAQVGRASASCGAPAGRVSALREHRCSGSARAAQCERRACFEPRAAGRRLLFCLQLGGSRRLRVGYVSYVFGEHPTAHLIYGALAHHNRRRIASACFALNPPDGSAARAKLVGACDTFADLAPLSVSASCGAVNAARMHVLVNLDGWTSLGRTNEIFVCGAAPRQLAYLGYPATLALESVTHFATDALSSPADSQVRSPWAPGAAAAAATAQRTVAAALRRALQDHYTEKLVYIAGGYYTADYGAYGTYRSADESDRPIGHDRRLRVCNYNNLYKVRARILTTAGPAQRSSVLVRVFACFLR